MSNLCIVLWKKSYSVPSIKFLVRTFCYCDSEPSQHCWCAALRFTYFMAFTKNARKNTRKFSCVFHWIYYSLTSPKSVSVAIP